MATLRITAVCAMRTCVEEVNASVSWDEEAQVKSAHCFVHLCAQDEFDSLSMIA